MSEKFVLVSLEEEKAKKLAEAISNSTARKILDYLSEKEEAPATVIARHLRLPLTTVDYNIKNLKKAGLVEVEEFKWSEKGRQMDLYKVAKKFIVISPKGTSVDPEKLKNLFSIAIIAGLGSVLAGYFAKSFLTAKQTLESFPVAQKTMALAADSAPILAETTQSNQLGFYLTLFSVGALFALVVFALLNLNKR